MSHTDVMTGKILVLARNWAEIEVEVRPGVRENMHVDTEIPGFGELFAGEAGSWVKLEVETFPAGVTSGHDNYGIVEVIGVFYPPIVFEWDGKTYQVPLKAAEGNAPIAVVIDRGTAVRISWWKESNPPQPGEVTEIPIRAAKSITALTYILEKEYGRGNVFTAEWIPKVGHPDHPPIA